MADGKGLISGNISQIAMLATMKKKGSEFRSNEAGF